MCVFVCTAAAVDRDEQKILLLPQFLIYLFYTQAAKALHIIMNTAGGCKPPHRTEEKTKPRAGGDGECLHLNSVMHRVFSIGITSAASAAANAVTQIMKTRYSKSVFKSLRRKIPDIFASVLFIYFYFYFCSCLRAAGIELPMD